MMDNHFKDKLKQYKVEWDKDLLWEELEPKLPKRTTRFRNYWWVLLPLLFIPTCWSQLAEIENSNLAAAQIIVSDNEQVEVKANTEQQTSIIADNESNEIIKAKDDFIQKQRVVAFPVKEKINTEDIQAKPLSVLSSLPPFSKAMSTLSDVPSTTLSSSPGFYSVPAKSNKQHSNTKKNTAGKISNTRPLTPAAFIANKQEQSVVLPIEKLALSIVDTPLSGVPKKPMQHSPELTQSMTKPVRTRGVFVNVLVSSGALRRDLDFTGVEPVDIEQISVHKNREVPDFAWNTQVEMGYRHRSGWSLSGGLGYNQLHERFTFDAVVRTDTTVETSNRARYFVKSSGDTLFLSGPAVYTEVETRRIWHNNRMAYYQIPLSLGYYYPRGRLGVEVGAGLNYLFRQQYRGRVSEGEPVEIVNDPGFTLKTPWGYHMRLGVQYQLFNATHLFIAGQYFRSPEFVRGGVSQRYSSYGMQVGLQYRL